MAGIVRGGAMTVGLAAAVRLTRHRAGPEIAECEELLEKTAASRFQVGQGLRQGAPPYLNIPTYSDEARNRRNQQNLHFYVVHPTMR